MRDNWDKHGTELVWIKMIGSTRKWWKQMIRKKRAKGVINKRENEQWKGEKEKQEKVSKIQKNSHYFEYLR